MLDLMQRLFAGRKNETGASAVEYGLLVAAIAAIVVAMVFLLGGQVNTAFKSTCDKIKTGAATTVSAC